MSLLESILIPLGTKMPAFELSDPHGKMFKGEDLYGQKGLLLGFSCNHCPYAIAVWPRFIRLAAFAEPLGIGTAMVNPNINPDYPKDAPDQMIEKIKEWGISFPYLVDDGQDVARQFKAQCTPDIYLFNNERELVYHGRIDDNWKDEKGWNNNQDHWWKNTHSDKIGEQSATSYEDNHKFSHQSAQNKEKSFTGTVAQINLEQRIGRIWCDDLVPPSGVFFLNRDPHHITNRVKEQDSIVFAVEKDEFATPNALF